MFGNDRKNQNCVHEEIENRLNFEDDNETSDSINGEARPKYLSDC